MTDKRYLFILVVAILLVTATQVMFKLLAKNHGDNLYDIIYDYRFYISIFIYLLAFVLWIVALSKIEFSIAIPLNIITIIFGGIFGYFIFHEEITYIKSTGYIFMIIGVLILCMA